MSISGVPAVVAVPPTAVEGVAAVWEGVAAVAAVAATTMAVSPMVGVKVVVAVVPPPTVGMVLPRLSALLALLAQPLQ